MSDFESKDHLVNRIMHYLGRSGEWMSAAVLSNKLKVKPGNDLQARLSWLIEKGLIEQVNSSRIYNGLPVKIYRRIK